MAGRAVNGIGGVWNTEREEMSAFDRLPRKLRDAVNHAPEMVSAVTVLKLVPKFDPAGRYQHLCRLIRAARHV